MYKPGPAAQSGPEDGKEPPSPSIPDITEITGHFIKTKALGRVTVTITKQADLLEGREREKKTGQRRERTMCF